MSAQHNPATCPCGGHECDACHAIDPGYGPPWGWTIDAWDEYVENSFTTALVRDVNSGNDFGLRASSESFSWCVLVILLSTAAMALLSDELLAGIEAMQRGEKVALDLELRARRGDTIVTAKARSMLLLGPVSSALTFEASRARVDRAMREELRRIEEMHAVVLPTDARMEVSTISFATDIDAPNPVDNDYPRNRAERRAAMRRGRR